LGTARRTVCFKGSVEMMPAGASAARRARRPATPPRRKALSASRGEPGKGSQGALGRKMAPAERSASATGRPELSTSPSKTSPAECATMNQGGTPPAIREPIMAPAEVPRM